MKIVIQRKEREVFNELKESVLEQLRTTEEKFESKIKRKGITIDHYLLYSEIKIDSKMLIDTLVMIYRMIGVFIALGLNIKNSLAQMSLIEKGLNKIWKREGEEDDKDDKEK